MPASDIHRVIDAVVLAEVLQLEHLPDFDLAIDERRAAGPLDGLFLRLRLDEPEAGDELLGFRERPVHDGRLAALERDTRALRAGLQALAREHHSVLDHLFVELAHLRKFLLAGQHARFRFLRRLDDEHETHWVTSPFDMSS